MQFQVNITPVAAGAGGNFNIGVVVEAADLVAALEAAKEPIRKSAETQARALYSALPAADAEPPPTPPA